MKKIRLPEFSISVLNLKLNNIGLTAKEHYNKEKNEIQNNDYYTCKICSNLVIEPKSCSECNDLFCTKCINYWLSKNNFCPNCKSGHFKERSINKLIRNFLNNIEIECPLDCKESFKYQFLDKHFERCTNTIKNCRCKLCEKLFVIKGKDFTEIFNHMKTCESMVYECGFCDEIVNNHMDQDHNKTCVGVNFNKCSVCNINYPDKFSKAHKEYFCKIILDITKLSFDLFD